MDDPNAPFQGYQYQPPPSHPQQPSQQQQQQQPQQSLYNFVQAQNLQSSNNHYFTGLPEPNTSSEMQKRSLSHSSRLDGRQASNENVVPSAQSARKKPAGIGQSRKLSALEKLASTVAEVIWSVKAEGLVKDGRSSLTIKREIAHLCRDCSPPPHSHGHNDEQKPEPQQSQSHQRVPQPPGPPPTSQAPVYPESNFPPSWPLLPEANGNQVPFGEAPERLQSINDAAGLMGPPATTWGTTATKEEGELAALNKFMKDLGVPNLPNDFLSFMNQLDNPTTANNLTVPSTSSGLPDIPSQSAPGQPRGLDKGKGKEMSRVDKYLMAAADQPNGTRASRLAQVIKAKYDAGLLKPYDYVKGYERMNKWMESGRAAPKMESRAGSEIPESPHQKGVNRNGMLSIASIPAPVFGKSISPESRRRILAALAGFRPKFRQIARTLTNVDLVFVEEAMERWMLEYDRALASIHTPSCIWRRTGEIQKANQEFSNLTGIPASMFRDGQLCVYELMDEDSAVRYWEGYAKIAFDPSQRSFSIPCTLHIPLSLARHRPRHLSAVPLPAPSKSAASAPPSLNVPDLALPQQGIYAESPGPSEGVDRGVNSIGREEQFREMQCMFSVTIRRDAWGVPVAIMGQWIVSDCFSNLAGLTVIPQPIQ
ncbi:transcriptional regulatory protein [Cryptococcus wingfieldii CBS 7118]|uniref:Transcriptional regulatory protein n=1 Tax=Cryptococcus wingfieldii CBS 7118 TaxID=1295528 RepID=A0A1E3JC92_9TREE|nr:transcriptional regulatory protein [Cryptococcus wingfieldii CBS 7118]ODN98452.1 transcriptional regulatory protein [Cryptococcus wingfieldii CBS 7118]